MDNIPPNRLKGKIAIVTASSKGIGFAIVKRLAQEGAQVILSSRKQEHIDSALAQLTSTGLKVRGVQCHVSNGEQRKKLFEEADKLGGLDILVSNAGINPTRPSMINCGEELWDKMLDLNVTSAFLIAKESIPLMRKRGGGAIVFISSVCGYHPLSDFFHFPNGDSPVGAYSVCKTALCGLTKALTIDVAKFNIRVNCVAPGGTATKFVEFVTENKDTTEWFRRHVPMQKFGTVEDVSGVVSFVVSEDASYITGETIVVAGGIPSRL